MKKGFTLVELSIVLVIIGLLIGGILAAQSMIGTAKIQGVVRQLQQYDVAVANFQTKYGQLPGDSNLFSGGNNDGQIGESGNFWSDLSLGVNLKNSQGTNYQPYTQALTPVSELNLPKFNITQDTTQQPCLNAQYFDMSVNTGINYGGAKNYYNYNEAGAGNIIGVAGGQSPLQCKDLLAIDLKIDDGKPFYGKLLSFCNVGGTDGYALTQR